MFQLNHFFQHQTTNEKSENQELRPVIEEESSIELKIVPFQIFNPIC